MRITIYKKYSHLYPTWKVGATLPSVTTTSESNNICFFCGFRGQQSQDFWPYKRVSKTINPGSDTRVQNVWQARPGEIFCVMKPERKEPLEQRPRVSSSLANSTQHLFGIRSISDSRDLESLQGQPPL